MGYCINQREANFSMSAANAQKAAEAIKNLHGKETIKDSSGKHFSFVANDFYKRCDTFQNAMYEWRWSIELGEEGEIIAIDFVGEKYGDDKLLFDAIAPFVEPGCYIEMQGEDGAIWRLIFDGKTCKQKSAKVTW